MESSNYHRQKELYKRLNDSLSDITGINTDFLSNLTNDKLINLKYALSDINNIVTLKTSLAFIDYISLIFSLTPNEKLEIVDRLNSTKPNSNGYDIYFKNKNVSFFAEIKSTVPINKGTQFGIAQINSILDDAIKLQNGKRGIDTSNAYKFIGVLDLGDTTLTALKKVFRGRNIRIMNDQRDKRNKIKTHLALIEQPKKFTDLIIDKIHVVPIKI